MQDDVPATIRAADGTALAYHRIAPAPSLPPGSPGIVFLGGLRSDMTGSKALALDSLCRQRGWGFLRFDYFGHGASGGAFEDGTIGRWRADALLMLDHLTEGPQLLVGSSLGGWIALLAALARPDRIAGLIGIAAAPDFTEDLMWAGMDAAQRETLLREGVLREPSAYDPEPTPITRRLIEEGRDHLLLRGPVPIAAPIRLLHGQADPDVPWQTSLRLAEALTATDLRITLIKDGDHRLSRPPDLRLLTHTVAELVAT